MPWAHLPPSHAGHYWYRQSTHGPYRVVRLGYPGRTPELLDCHARPGEPRTASEMLDVDPHGAFHFPGLEIPDVNEPAVAEYAQVGVQE